VVVTAIPLAHATAVVLPTDSVTAAASSTSGKRKADALSSEELAAHVLDGVRASTKSKYASAEPWFAKYCKDSSLDPSVERHFIDADGSPQNGRIGRFMMYVKEQIMQGTICASALYNDKSQGTAINWAHSMSSRCS